jgi:hypothetical protein
MVGNDRVHLESGGQKLMFIATYVLSVAGKELLLDAHRIDRSWACARFSDALEKSIHEKI